MNDNKNMDSTMAESMTKGSLLTMLYEVRLYWLNIILLLGRNQH